MRGITTQGITIIRRTPATLKDRQLSASQCRLAELIRI
jgi:hypothetical protein